jgi:hypothetical protein
MTLFDTNLPMESEYAKKSAEKHKRDPPPQPQTYVINVCNYATFMFQYLFPTTMEAIVLKRLQKPLAGLQNQHPQKHLTVPALDAEHLVPLWPRATTTQLGYSHPIRHPPGHNHTPATDNNTETHRVRC